MHAINLAYFKQQGHTHFESYIRSIILCNKVGKRHAADYGIPGFSERVCATCARALLVVSSSTIARWLKGKSPIPFVHEVKQQQT
tara:strand:- start:748 stop:1002 length:255 start_codon:yes stop_codon:yes gene_type:complete